MTRHVSVILSIKISFNCRFLFATAILPPSDRSPEGGFAVIFSKRRTLLSSVSKTWLAASIVIAGTAAIAGPSFADDASQAQQIEQLQKQLDAQQQMIKQTQQELEMVKSQAVMAQTTATKARTDAQAAQASTATGASSNGLLSHGILYKSSAVTLQLGGFVEAATFWRDHDEVADVGSSYTLAANGIPLPLSANYNADEYRASARQSRLSLLAQGDDNLKSLAAYFEFDFLGAAVTANSKESNSYTPRIRHVYLTYDDKGDGLHVLAGQTWSLLMLDRQGITPRTEDVPLTIDAQYTVGTIWTRNPQVRIVDDVSKEIHVGLSLESPQAVIFNSGGYLGAGTSGQTAVGNVNFSTAAGGSLLNSTTSYTWDQR